MAPSLAWTRSIAAAWEYIVYGIAQGYKPTEAYREYTAGGGQIRTSSWFEAWHEAQQISPNSDFVIRMPDEWTLPAGRFTDVAWDTAQNYIVQAHMSFFDREQKRFVDEWRTVEFDQPPTKAELNRDIEAKLLADYSNRQVAGWALLDVKMYHSTGPVLD